jgi:hypothetical protein
MTGQRTQQETGIDLRVLSRCTHVAGIFSRMLKPTGRSAWKISGDATRAPTPNKYNRS